MSVEELINKFSNEQGFKFGIDIVMESLCPNSIYSLAVESGYFKIVYWDKSNTKTQPSSTEIREEYLRHQAIKETLDYIRNKEK